MSDANYTYVPGMDFGIYRNDSLILAATDNQMSWSRDMIEVTNKQTGAKVYIPGKYDGTTSGTCRAVKSTSENFKPLAELLPAGTKVVIKYSDGKTGEPFYQFDAYLQQLDRTDPDNDASSFTYAFQQTGGLTVGTVPAQGD